MKNPFRALKLKFKKNNAPSKKPANRRLTAAEMAAQQKQLKERKEREAARLKAQKASIPMRHAIDQSTNLQNQKARPKNLSGPSDRAERKTPKNENNGVKRMQ